MPREITEQAKKACENFKRLGLKAFCGKRTKEARNYFERAIKADPSDLDAFRELRNCRLPGDSPDRELLLAREAVRLNPGSAQALECLAVCLICDWRYTEAEPELRLALTFAPQNPSITGTLAYVLQMQEKYGEAEALLINAKEFPGISFDTIIDSLEAQGKKREIKEFCERNIKSNKHPLAFYLKLVEIYQAEGDYNKAKALVEAMDQRFPDPLCKLLLLTKLNLAQGQPGRALELAREAVKLKSDAHSTEPNLAAALIASGDIEGGLEVLRKMADSSVVYRSDLAAEFKTLGRLAEATAEYRRILAETPQDESARAALAEILRGSGAAQEALKLWKDYAELHKNYSAYAALALEQLKQGNHAEGLNNCLRAMKLTIKDQVVSNRLIECGKIEECLELANCAPVAIDKGLTTSLIKVYSALGRIYEGCCQHGWAAEAFAKAVKLAPGSVSALLLATNALKRQRK